MASQSHNLIAALDIGTTKTCCLIGRRSPAGLAVIGAGHQLSQGMRGGTVVDMEAVEISIRAAVDAAERMVGATVDDVHATFASGQPKSHTIGIEIAIGGHEVGDRDLTQALEDGRRAPDLNGGRIVHALPVGYTIDGERGIHDPRGMVGDRLGVDIHVVTAQPAPLKNMQTCIERGHLDLADFVVAPYAAGLASLVDDEKELGVTLVDMGGGVTTLAVFSGGALRYADVVPVGGNHITNDLARGLLIPTSHAERIKTLHGAATAAAADDRAMVTIQPLGEGEDDAGQVSRAGLSRIIQPRVEETFEMVRDRLEASGMDQIAGRRLVLTGGASQLPGVRDLAARILKKQVRIGRPVRVSGLPEAMNGPAFAASVGLLVYASEQPRHARRMRGTSQTRASSGPLASIGRWLRENF